MDAATYELGLFPSWSVISTGGRLVQVHVLYAPVTQVGCGVAFRDRPLGRLQILYDYFAASVSLLEVSNGRRYLPKAVIPVDDGYYLSGRQQVADRGQIPLVWSCNNRS